MCAVGGLRVDGGRNTHTHTPQGVARVHNHRFLLWQQGRAHAGIQKYCVRAYALVGIDSQTRGGGRKMRIARTSQNRSHTPQQFAAGSLMLLLVSILLLCAIKIGKSIHQKLLLLHTHARRRRRKSFVRQDFSGASRFFFWGQVGYYLKNLGTVQIGRVVVALILSTERDCISLGKLLKYLNKLVHKRSRNGGRLTGY